MRSAMVAALLLLLTGGIALTLAVSDPRAVTLSWLRLGGLNALALSAVAGVVLGLTHSTVLPLFWLAFAVLLVLLIAQLLLVQTARRVSQRVCCAASYLAAGAAVLALLISGAVPGLALPAGSFTTWPLATHLHWAGITVTILLASGILGGFLMSMLLGHAYLTAGNEMTQRPFLRLVYLLVLVMLGRALLSGVTGLLPFLNQSSYGGMNHLWDVLMVWTRYLVGLALPGVFLYMIHDCVRRRSNQSATGILYVAAVLVILGEGVSLSLLRSTGLVF